MEIIIKGVKVLLRYGAYSSGMIVTIIIVILLFGGDEIMEINNPPDRVDYIKTIGGGIIRPHVINIGAWNMDSTMRVLIEHGLGTKWDKILSITFVIYRDDGTYIKLSPAFNNAVDPNLVQVGVEEVTDTYIKLIRRAGSGFDSIQYDDAVMNRGKILAWIEE